MTSIPAIRIRTQRKVSKPSIWPGDAFDGAVVLLDEVVEVLRLAHLDGQTAIGLNAHDGGRVGAAEGTKCFFGAICGSGPITTLIPGFTTVRLT